ncbi:hypothetical protein JN11_01565 [Mucilaginibacter frigoritolerans]|uniref:Uncharacterized protein n=1 Tax=Mucilaginibacter frigoritolerans TaxID=652788 RepID=A0A562U9R1_9SPHI|nr:hypothetical protein [Mucilaginibacter frigoritolerans]TWJ02592.1 hypothetical protein JN11_01565 [Mucilaginibacter frigoritolerans]
MKLHEIYPHNKFLLYIGAILGFTGTYLDNTNKASFTITMSLLIAGLLLMLLSFKKPKQSSNDENKIISD